jgi:hypothetical protein
VFGVGYVGVGKYLAFSNGIEEPAYNLWIGMLNRCYYVKSLKASPTYRDCTVAKEWHNYQNFAKWYEDNYVEGYQLDKDIKVEGNRVYGPDTCMFVTSQENSEKANAKHYTLVSPKGTVVEVYNLMSFCRDNNLNTYCLYSVMSGNRKHHKGWTKNS